MAEAEEALGGEVTHHEGGEVLQAVADMAGGKRFAVGLMIGIGQLLRSTVLNYIKRCTHE